MNTLWCTMDGGSERGINLGEFNYGGQAVIEGVMMRGATRMAIAVRDPTGNIVVHSEPLNPKIYAGRISKLPFLRALTALWDALVLGIRGLLFSADVALGEEGGDFAGPVAWGTVALSLTLAVAIFLVAPLLLVRLLERYIASALASNVAEGLIRLAFLLLYIYAIGFIPDIKRVFAYHGAEHKTINAYEGGADLSVDGVRPYPKAHARCGTAFLLTVAVVTILVFAPLGKPPLLWRVLSRLVLLPLITGIAYEILRLTARLADRPLMRLLIAPNLALQRLTTREPDDAMLEVAIAALKAVLASEEETGAVVWAGGNDRSGYSSPVIATLAGRRAVDGDRVERKHGCVALHWRGMSEADILKLRNVVETTWKDIAVDYGLGFHSFDGGFELRASGRDKGSAVRESLAEAHGPVAAAYLGDDLTDEDGFRAVKAAGGLAVLVRSEYRAGTEADAWLRPPDELLHFLNRWSLIVNRGGDHAE